MDRPPSLSILVAFRGEGWRRTLWEFLRPRLEMIGEVVEASDDGGDPFHKTLALNRAARAASGEVLGIWDADVWVSPEQVDAGLEFLTEHPERWVRPWTVKLKLNEAATRHVLAQPDWDGTIDHRPFGRPENRNTYWAAPPLLLRREAFWDIGGMDERFRGWGQEDGAFATALTRLVGRPRVLRGLALHLWHPRRGSSGKDLWDGQESTDANRALYGRYMRATSPEAMREVVGG